jgi:hypothetical protein
MIYSCIVPTVSTASILVGKAGDGSIFVLFTIALFPHFLHSDLNSQLISAAGSSFCTDMDCVCIYVCVTMCVYDNVCVRETHVCV